jgi:hypothetical protein
MNRLLLFVLLCLLPFLGAAQQFGGNPTSMKWKQINTDTARIIFPDGLDSVAQRVASIVHYLAAHNPAPLGNKLYKINIVLQTQTTVSNGYVSLAPFRSEYYLMPVMNNFELGSTPWSEALAVHEYRHVQQFNNFRNGLSKAVYYLFGEEGLVVATGGAIPDWFYEGDAVYNETITTNQGRGRLPLFLNQYKSLWLAGKNYSWMKLRNGSLKDYVPDHYPLGYLMVNYGREKYGIDFWTKVTHDASAFKGLFYPFQKAIKRYTGVDYKTFHEQAFDYYKSSLPSTQNIEAASGKYLSVTREKTVTNYYFPYQMADDSLLYLKDSYRQLSIFYIRDSSGEHKIRTRDISFDNQFGYRNGRIVYAAYEADARWNWRDYSVIKIIDVHTGEQRTLAHKTKYFTPDISNDGNMIAAVQVEPGGKSSLLVLNANDGRIVQQFHSREINLFTDPKFVNDSMLVTAVRLNDGRMALAIADIGSGVVERLTLPSYAAIGYLSPSQGLVYYTSSLSGNDELYAVEIKSKKVFKITSSQLGNYFVNASPQGLVWSEFTANGYKLKQLDFSDIHATEITEPTLTTLVPDFPVSHSNELHDILQSTVPARQFSVSRYKQGSHLFHFHSWRPYYEDPDFTYSIYSDNILNTFSTEIFYHYNSNERTSGAGANLIYGGFYPYISGGMEYTFNRPVTIGGKKAFLDELSTRIGLSIPFDFTRGKTLKFLTIGTDFAYNRQSFKGSFKDSLGNTGFSYLRHYIAWSHYNQTSVQHIFPRLGYRLSAEDRHALNKYSAYQLLANATLYLPGAMATHNIVFTASFQRVNPRDIVFANRFAGSRGYNDYYFSQMWRVSGNYHFPICYPDFGIGNLVYLQRIRGNMFYDFTKVYSVDRTASINLRSAGLELHFDTKWWNEYPLSFGIRFSHLFDADLVGAASANVFEILVPVVIPK